MNSYNDSSQRDANSVFKNYHDIVKGIVVKVTDPNSGEIQVRVPCYHRTDSDGLKDTNLPTAYPCYNLDGSQRNAQVGDVVWITFEGGDIRYPVYLGVLKNNYQPPASSDSTTTSTSSGGLYNIKLSQADQKMVESLCAGTDIDPVFIFAEMEQESDFNASEPPNSYGAEGILQILKSEASIYAGYAGMSPSTFDPMNIQDSVKSFIGFYKMVESKYKQPDQKTQEAYVAGMWNQGVNGYLSRVKSSGVWFWYNTQVEQKKTAIEALLIPGSTTSSGTASVSGGLTWPLPGFSEITSPFGPRILYGKPNFHTGIDISGSDVYGKPIVAAAAGTVSQVVDSGSSSYGLHPIITASSSSGALTFIYGHTSKVLVSQGQSVTAGQQIALVGSTGNSTGPHLHFELRINNNPVDPMPYLKGTSKL